MSYYGFLYLLIWIALLLLNDGYGQVKDGSVTMTLYPSAGRIIPGDTAMVECCLAVPDQNTSIFWFRREGDVGNKIGFDGLVTWVDGDSKVQRYNLEQVKDSPCARTYKLTLTDAKLEDSATIECRLSSNLSLQAEASQSIIVCPDTSSEICRCMTSKGWASPECFTAEVNESMVMAAADKWRDVVGLIVALVVMATYALVVGLIGKRDSLREWYNSDPDDEQLLRREPGTKDLGKPQYEDVDRTQTDPSDSASDTATTATFSTSDPSSSSDTPLESYKAPQGTQRSAGEQEVTRRGQTAGQKSKKNNETTLIVRPEMHRNHGYKRDDEHTEIQHPPPPVETHQLTTPLAGHGLIAGYLDVSPKYSPSPVSIPRSVHHSSSISVISGSGNRQKDQRNPTGGFQSQTLTVPSALPLYMDTEGTEI